MPTASRIPSPNREMLNRVASFRFRCVPPRSHPRCRHCGQRFATRPRRLCHRCYYDPSVRLQHPILPARAPGWVASLRRFADSWDRYRTENGEGDPGMGRHRPDDPATVAEMRKGFSA